MSGLTEIEIFECMIENFHKAIEHSLALASSPRKGPIYRQLREELKLIEGCCRQAAYWRQDARWLDFAPYMEQCHQKAGNWIRGIKQPGGGYKPLPPGKMHPNFVALANALLEALKRAMECKDKATGKVGMILPILANPDRDTRPVAFSVPPEVRTKSGLILPAGG